MSQAIDVLAGTTPGIDSSVVHAGDWRASELNSRSSCAMRTSSRGISSTSSDIVPRISVGKKALLPRTDLVHTMRSRLWFETKAELKR